MHIFVEQQFHMVSKKGPNCLLSDENVAMQLLVLKWRNDAIIFIDSVSMETDEQIH